MVSLSASLCLPRKVRRSQVGANAETFRTAIASCGSAGQWKQALLLLREVEPSKEGASAVIDNSAISVRVAMLGGGSELCC